MPSRKNESLKLDHFRLGEQYTREQIARFGSVAPLDNNREWHRHSGIQKLCCLVFHSVKDDFPVEHRYADLFVGEQFKWESQNQNAQDSPVIKRIMDGEDPVLLFCRVRLKLKGHACPFYYMGQLVAERQRGEILVLIEFTLLDFQKLVRLQR